MRGIDPPRRRCKLPSMITKARAVVPILVCSLIAIAFSGCVTKRTVTRNGSVKSEKYVVKRPFSGGN